MHFPAIWRHKFTDLANSKKNSILEKKKPVVDKSAWIKACGGRKCNSKQKRNNDKCQ